MFKKFIPGAVGSILAASAPTLAGEFEPQLNIPGFSHTEANEKICDAYNIVAPQGGALQLSGTPDDMLASITVGELAGLTIHFIPGTAFIPVTKNDIAYGQRIPITNDADFFGSIFIEDMNVPEVYGCIAEITAKGDTRQGRDFEDMAKEDLVYTLNCANSRIRSSFGEASYVVAMEPLKTTGADVHFICETRKFLGEPGVNP